MSSSGLEQALRDLPAIGRLVKDRPYRQVWRFEFAGKPYYLKFYPRIGLRDAVRRRFRGSPALREFQRLQSLQKAAIPSPRALASLIGYSINGIKGDAVLLEGIEPSTQLDRYLNHLELAGVAAPDHLDLVRQLGGLLRGLAGANLGHDDLHLGNFLVSNGKLYLLDGYAVHAGGLPMEDVQLLELSARPHATRADMLRTWRAIAPASRLPTRNPRGPAVWQSLLERSFKKDRYFGHLEENGWDGHCFKRTKFPRRWSPASQLSISDQEWRDAWPGLLKGVNDGQFEVLKRSRSGEVLGGELQIGGRAVNVVIKRPFRKYAYRYLIDPFRGSRAYRAWETGWKLVIRNVPTAWPLLLMEKRAWGYVTDALVVFERIDGKPLSDPSWQDLPREQHQLLLFRVGRLLRQLESSGLHLYDAKTSNWIIRDDSIHGLTPMIIDVDGIRRFPRASGGMARLVPSLLETHPGLRKPDALNALFHGYAPFSPQASAAVAPLAQEALP